MSDNRYEHEYGERDRAIAAKAAATPETSAIETIQSALAQAASDASELATIRATLLANFGPDAKLAHIVAIQDDKTQSSFQLMFRVLEAICHRIEAKP